MEFTIPKNIPADQARKQTLIFINKYVSNTNKSFYKIAQNLDIDRASLHRSMNPDTSINFDRFIEVINEIDFEIIIKPKYPIIIPDET